MGDSNAAKDLELTISSVLVDGLATDVPGPEGLWEVTSALIKTVEYHTEEGLLRKRAIIQLTAKPIVVES